MILHFSFKCPDINAVINFYGSFFGARVIHRFERDDGSCYGVMLLLGHFSMLEIFELYGSVPVDTRHDANFTHICIHVSDIERSFRGFPDDCIVEPIRRGRTDRALQFRVRDPAGNCIEVQSLDDQVIYNGLTLGEVNDLLGRIHKLTSTPT